MARTKPHPMPENPAPSETAIPVVLVFGGADPTGGAGLQADIEATASHGCHAASVVTAVTAQDTTNVVHFTPQPPESVFHQARLILEDLEVHAVKIGMLGTPEIAEAVEVLLAGHSHLPVVLDPVLAAGGGGPLAGEGLAAALRRLCGRATVVTPNGPEARTLARGADTLHACAMELLETGARHVLLTGGHEPGEEVVNTLYDPRGPVQQWRWPRLPGAFHGTGCTLAATLAARLAQGQPIPEAARIAQEYTWRSIRHAFRAGRGQCLPDRFHWCRGR